MFITLCTSAIVCKQETHLKLASWHVGDHQMYMNTILNLILTIAFTFGFPSSDPGSHWAGSRPAAKNWAESLGAVTPSGRPCWGPEPPPVPHHQADAPLNSPQHWAERPSPCSKPQHSRASERPQADCRHRPRPPAHSLPLQSPGAAAFSAKLSNCRNNLNTLFSLIVNLLFLYTSDKDLLIRWNNCLLYLEARPRVWISSAIKITFSSTKWLPPQLIKFG